jgi:hypothetical protein
MKFNRQVYYIIITLFLITMSLTFAQEPPSPSDRTGTPGPPGTPIDGGVFALFVAGVFYGVKKAIKKK